MKMHGLEWKHLKTWKLEDLYDKLNKYFIRIDTNYLENSQHMRVIFIKQGL